MNFMRDVYLLQWQYSYGTGLGTGGARHVVIRFSNDKKMVEITHDARIGSGL